MGDFGGDLWLCGEAESWVAGAGCKKLRKKRCGCSERVCVIEERNCEQGEGFIVVLSRAKECSLHF
jgi:hypothetical protein